MNCPKCLGDSHVVDSRSAKGGATIRRRRECISCGERWTTSEYAVSRLDEVELRTTTIVRRRLKELTGMVQDLEREVSAPVDDLIDESPTNTLCEVWALPES